jgi:hypothetical protein
MVSTVIGNQRLANAVHVSACVMRSATTWMWCEHSNSFSQCGMGAGMLSKPQA